MAWPKGKPRKPKNLLVDTETAQVDPSKWETLQVSNVPLESADGAPTTPYPTQAAPAPTKKPLMKARPNWENFAPEADDDMGPLHIPRDLFPPGFDFQWVTSEVYGQSLPRERAKYERGGWTPVHQEDFDGIFDGRFMPKGASGEINVDGLVLMARPLKFSIEAKKREQREARERVAIKEQQLRGGENSKMMGADHPSALATNRINKTVEQISIPRDE